jgi:colanic acid biosynthesis glycosyl transferase WcaI
VRILILSQWFTPEPTLKGLSFARALAGRGHDVQVLTGYPNYPGGRIYEGFKVRLFESTEVQGISILRVALYPSHDNSAFRRLLNYTSFAISAAVIGPFAVRRAEVMYVYHPPASVALPALLIGKLRGIPIVYDIQDLWPDTLRATGMVNSKILLWLVEKWSQLTYRGVDRIVVLSGGFKKALVARGVPESKIEIIHNWSHEDLILPILKSESLAQNLGLADRFNILFAGTMGKAQGLDAVISAAEILRHGYPKIQFVLVGGGVEVDRMKRLVKDKALTNVVFLPRRPPSEIAGILMLADVLLVHLRKDPLFRITIPSKVQTYLSVGKPILVGVEGDAAEIVTKAKAGVAYDPEFPSELADACVRLYQLPKSDRDQMGINGRSYYQDHLSFSEGLTRFLHVFEAVARSEANGLL